MGKQDGKAGLSGSGILESAKDAGSEIGDRAVSLTQALAAATPEPVQEAFPVTSAVKKTSPAKRSGKPSARELLGPSPNPATNLAIADIALRSASMIARQGIERALLGQRYAPRKAWQILKGRPISEVLLHRAIAKVAMSSVPGALAMTGIMVAKTLYDRGKAHKATAEGEADLAEKAEDGRDG